MIIYLKNKHTLEVDDFKFRCSIGKNGKIKKKKEGDKKTPIGKFGLDNIYYRSDKKSRPISKINSTQIKKTMGWCNDIKAGRKYNKVINTNTTFNYEKLFRRDYKYDYFIPIKYNWKNTKVGSGSAIFIHLTKDYKPTAGCIGLSEKDFLILIKIINKKTKIKIL